MFPNQLSPYSAPFMAKRAKALSKEVNLKVVAPVSYFPFLRTNIPAYAEVIEGLEILHPPYLTMPSPLWFLRWRPYLGMLKKMTAVPFGEYDILHVEWIYPDAYAAVCFAKKYGTKTTAVVHGNEAIEYFGPLKLRKTYKKVLAALDRIIVVSADLKKKLINEYAVPADKVTVILNGVDLEDFPMIPAQEARSRLGIPEDREIGVCVARLSAEKNLDVLIRAIAQLQNTAPQIYIIGEGSLKAKLELLIDDLQVGNKVKLMGPLPHKEIGMWFNAADFLCLPSQREGCPVVIHEALACGVPVISTTVGAIPDLIKDDRFGLLCEPDSVSAFTAIMKHAMSKTWDREIISAYGRQFTWEKVAKQTVEVFKSVLESGR